MGVRTGVAKHLQYFCVSHLPSMSIRFGWVCFWLFQHQYGLVRFVNVWIGLVSLVWSSAQITNLYELTLSCTIEYLLVSEEPADYG